MFYEKQKAYESAKIYYKSVVDKHPDSAWANKASLKLQAIDKILEKKNAKKQKRKK